MSLYSDIERKYIDARKARDSFTSGVLSMLVSDLKYEKINKQKELEDGDVLAVLQKTLKQKKDALSEFLKAGRQDLSDKEQKEVDYLSGLLPPMMTEAEIMEIIQAVKTELAISSAADIGKLMKETMARVKGRADGAQVKNLVSASLK